MAQSVFRPDGYHGVPKDPTYGPNWGFAIPDKRNSPPISVSPPEWSRRSQTRGYIQRIKRSVQQVDAYLLLCRGRTRGLTGHQRDACHWFAQESTWDTERRARQGAKPDEGKRDVLTDSLRY